MKINKIKQMMTLLKKRNMGFIQLNFFVDQVSLKSNVYLKLIIIVMNDSICDLEYFLNYDTLLLNKHLASQIKFTSF